MTQMVLQTPTRDKSLIKNSLSSLLTDFLVDFCQLFRKKATYFWHPLIFRSLYEGLSFHQSVRPSVGLAIGCAFLFRAAEIEWKQHRNVWIHMGCKKKQGHRHKSRALVREIVKTCENLWKLVKTYENLWKLVKTCENLWKLVKTFENFWKLVKTFKNFWKLLKTCKNF